MTFVYQTVPPPHLRSDLVKPLEILLALAAAVVLRFWMLWFIDVKVLNDAATYDLLARNLLEHGVYSVEEGPPFTPTAYRPPLYPALVAAVYAFGGPNLLAVQVAQIALGILTIVLAFLCVRRLEPGIQRWVLWLLALSPFDAVYSVVLLSEALTSFLLAAGFTIWSWTRTRWRWPLLGAALGVATLCRDIYIALPPFFAALWFLWGEGNRRGRLQGVALLLASTLVVLAPWSIRNAAVLEQWAPVSSGRLGFSLWTGGWAINFSNVREVDGHRVYPAEAYLDGAERRQHEALLRAKDLNALDKFYRSSFIRRIHEEPMRVIGTWIARMPLLWLGTRFDVFELNARVLPYASPQWYAAKGVLFLMNALLVVAGAWGVVTSWYRRSPLRWLSVPILFTAAVYLPLNSFENRYSQPVYVLLLIFAAACMGEQVKRIRADMWPRADASPQPEAPPSNAS